jgi:hypothetical protein
MEIFIIMCKELHTLSVFKHSLQKEMASNMLQIMGKWEDTSTDYWI